ncbi:hypothetical protein BG006_001230 [Podila minutissima]|uniref:Uncharacterized protein n=1 Tax=Podila minutissima TaxID=64525 RepID=A0A9P5VGV3_9FUNG|nr:hypothetical protein BG006_001230 [Podila minutissima]
MTSLDTGSDVAALRNDHGTPNLTQAATLPPAQLTGQALNLSTVAQVATQTVVIQPIRYPAPGPFHGETDGFTAHHFISTITRYLNGNSIPIATRTLQTLPFLKGNAGLWWESTGLLDNTTFADFVKEFNNAYVPDDFILQVCLGLQTMTMTSTLSEFIARVHHYVAILTPPNASEAVLNEISITSCTTFLHGIPADLNSKIRTNTPTWKDLELADLISLTRHYDSIHHYSHDSSFTSSSSSSSPPAPARFSPMPANYTYAAPTTQDPMAMEIDNLHVELHAMQHSLNQYHNNNNQWRNNNNNNNNNNNYQQYNNNRNSNYNNQNRGNNNNNNNNNNNRNNS